MDQVHIMFWGMGIVFVVLAVVGTVKEAKESEGCILLVAWPVIIGLAAILYLGFLR
ncbi:hypothetical protein [Streptomyces sp. NPDC001401]|uniref:hypothetical protein n=1 Tax=Streptomyces sp. NPDC001401 TaxID=3364570 RepID=UPI00368A46B5